MDEVIGRLKGLYRRNLHLQNSGHSEDRRARFTLTAQIGVQTLNGDRNVGSNRFDTASCSRPSPALNDSVLYHSLLGLGSGDRFWDRLSEMGLSVKLTAWRLRRETSQLSLWQLTESSPRPVGLKWWDVSAGEERPYLPEVRPPRCHWADTNCLSRAQDSTVRHHRVAI